jgi:dTDP-4-dehydrorhamnose reductase
VDDCESNPNQAYLINTRVVENIVTWIKNCGPKTHLVQISTDHIYDGAGYKSEDKCVIVNTYAFSKYAAELALGGVSALTILRTNFFGKSFTPGRRSFTDWIYESLKSGMPIHLASNLYFNPVSLRFLARTIRKCIEDSVFGLFNVGSRGGMSKYEFGINFAQSLDLDMSLIKSCLVKDIGFKVPRPFDMRMDVLKVESILGDMPSLNSLISLEKNDYESI